MAEQRFVSSGVMPLSGVLVSEDGTEERFLSGLGILNENQAAGGVTTLTADAGSYAWTGQAATLLHNELISAEAGSYAWTGQDATLTKALLLGADAGSYVWTGQDATLIEPTVTTITAEAGSYAWTGSAAGLLHNEVLAADAGSYAWTGQDATLTVAIRLTAEAGSYAWTGSDASLLTAHVLSAEAASYIWTGSDATLTEPAAEAAATGGWLSPEQIKKLQAEDKRREEEQERRRTERREHAEQLRDEIERIFDGRPRVDPEPDPGIDAVETQAEPAQVAENRREDLQRLPVLQQDLSETLAAIAAIDEGLQNFSQQREEDELIEILLLAA